MTTRWVGEVDDVVGDRRCEPNVVIHFFRLSSSICIEPQKDSIGALSKQLPV